MLKETTQAQSVPRGITAENKRFRLLRAESEFLLEDLADRRRNFFGRQRAVDAVHVRIREIEGERVHLSVVVLEAASSRRRRRIPIQSLPHPRLRG